MKFSKVLTAVGVAVILFGALACGGGGGKYGALKSVMEKQMALYEEYATAMDKVTSAKDVVAAMNKLTEGMKTLVPQMKELQAKFANLDTMMKEPPAELKDLMTKLGASAGKMASAAMKAVPYMQDPEVQAAQKNFAEAMSSVK